MIKSMVCTISVVLAVALATAFSAIAAGKFDGTWSGVINGQSIEMVIDGAKATTSSSGLGASVGSVTEQDGTAVIKWESGGTSVVSKEGEGYMARYYAAGTPLDGNPDLSAELKKE